MRDAADRRPATNHRQRSRHGSDAALAFYPLRQATDHKLSVLSASVLQT